MDSATPLEPAPAAPPMLAAVEPELLELVDKWYENLQKAPLPEEVFHWLGKPNCPVSQGGGDTYPLFPGENRESVAVAAPGNMVKSGMTQSVEVLLRSGPMWLFRLAEKSERRKVEKSGSRNSRNLAAAGGDRIPLFPGKEPVAVATPRTRVKCGITK